MNARSKQTGMVLLISLVMLLLLTIIAITAASQSTLQTRMASNSQQQNIAFQAAESGISAWVKDYESKTVPVIDAFSVSGNMRTDNTVPFTASAPLPGNCWNVVPATSLNANEGGSGTFQYACFNIESKSKACADSTCAAADNPAQADHLQGHLVRY